VTVDGALRVSALWQGAKGAKACFVMAHGAGAGMRHPFLESSPRSSLRIGSQACDISFPSMDRGSKRPDPPELCHATVRAAVAEASRRSSVR